MTCVHRAYLVATAGMVQDRGFETETPCPGPYNRSRGTAERIARRILALC